MCGVGDWRVEEPTAARMPSAVPQQNVGNVLMMCNLCQPAALARPPSEPMWHPHPNPHPTPPGPRPHLSC